jgi:hypothetical protein
LTSCSCGNSSVRADRSRIRKGVIPMAISATLAASPTPSVMNRIGSTASGGIIDRIATKV